MSFITFLYYDFCVCVFIYSFGVCHPYDYDQSACFLCLIYSWFYDMHAVPSNALIASCIVAQMEGIYVVFLDVALL